MLTQGQFGAEAIAQLVDCMTKPKFAGRLVIILSGYEDDINELLRLNQGLASRFPEDFIFPPIDPETSLNLLVQKLHASDMSFPYSSETRTKMLKLIRNLCRLPGWANARDIETLTKDITRSVWRSHTKKLTQVEVTGAIAIACMEKMYAVYLKRSGIALRPSTPPMPSSSPKSRPPSTTALPQAMLQAQYHQAVPNQASAPSTWNVSNYGPAYFTNTGQQSAHPFLAGSPYHTPQPHPVSPYGPMPPTGPTPPTDSNSSYPMDVDMDPSHPMSNLSLQPTSRPIKPLKQRGHTATATRQQVQSVASHATRSNTQPIFSVAGYHGVAADTDHEDPMQTSDDENSHFNHTHREATRDAGVSDEVWEGIQQAKKLLKSQKAARERDLKEKLEAVRVVEEARRQAEEEAERLAKEALEAKNEAQRKEFERQQAAARETERIMEEQRKKAQKFLDDLRAAEKVRAKEEAKEQARLKRMGRCPANYDWYQVAGGDYYCEGGSHALDAGGRLYHR